MFFESGILELERDVLILNGKDIGLDRTIGVNG